MAGPSPTQPWWRRWFGSRSERAAARFLKRLAIALSPATIPVLRANLTLFAVDGRCVVFVEVRSTEQEGHGPPYRLGR